MSEERAIYSTAIGGLLQDPCKGDSIDTSADTLRSQLTDMERQLISLLVIVQRALGKEPSVITRSERRRG